MVLKFRMRTEVSEETVEKFSNLSFLKIRSICSSHQASHGEAALSVWYPKAGASEARQLSPGLGIGRVEGEASVEASGSSLGPSLEA